MMHHKLFAFFVFIFICLTMISFAVEGEGGLAATQLTAAVDDDDTTLNVTSTTGFLDADILYVGNEVMAYNGKTSTTFTSVTRAYRSTKATNHASETRVYNEATGVVNQVAGFNIAETMSTAGLIQTAKMLPGALTRAVPKLVMWDYSYLTGNLFGFPLVYLKYLLFAISAGFIVALIFAMVSIFMGIARIFV